MRYAKWVGAKGGLEPPWVRLLAARSEPAREQPNNPGKCRWQVELFFKWIKQHLRIKAFYGTSENAVKTQIWIAVSIYVLVAIVRKRLGLERSLYQILQILSITTLEKMPILQVFEAFDSQSD